MKFKPGQTIKLIAKAPVAEEDFGQLGEILAATTDHHPCPCCGLNAPYLIQFPDGIWWTPETLIELPSIN